MCVSGGVGVGVNVSPVCVGATSLLFLYKLATR